MTNLKRSWQISQLEFEITGSIDTDGKGIVPAEPIPDTSGRQIPRTYVVYSSSSNGVSNGGGFNFYGSLDSKFEGVVFHI